MTSMRIFEQPVPKKYESYQYCYISTPYQEIGDGGFTTVNTSSMEQVEYANMKLQYP